MIVGHAQTGGFAVVPDKVHTLQEDLASAAARLPQREKEQAPESDLTVTLPQVSWELFRDLGRLAPFGVGNPKPILRISRAKVVHFKRFGKEQNHVEVTLECCDSGTSARAYDFFRAPEGFTHVPALDQETTALATIEKDTFRGGLALRLVDMLPA